MPQGFHGLQKYYKFRVACYIVMPVTERCSPASIGLARKAPFLLPLSPFDKSWVLDKKEMRTTGKRGSCAARYRLGVEVQAVFA